MTQPFSIIHAIADRLHLSYASPELTSIRNTRILDHYQREIDRWHMSSFTAIERCIGDLCGANHNPIYTQRTQVCTWTKSWPAGEMLRQSPSPGGQP